MTEKNENRWRWVPIVAGLGAIVTALVMVGAIVWQSGYITARIDDNKTEVDKQRAKSDAVLPRVTKLEGKFESFEKTTAKTLEGIGEDVRDIRKALDLVPR